MFKYGYGTRFESPFVPTKRRSKASKPALCTPATCTYGELVAKVEVRDRRVAHLAESFADRVTACKAVVQVSSFLPTKPSQSP